MLAPRGTPEAPFFDTVVVAGGRSSRLGGTPKAQLPVGGTTLLGRTVDAVLPFGTVVVVGPEDPTLPSRVLTARENPPYSGPAAGVAAGVSALRRAAARRAWTAVLACDMPEADHAVATLRSAAGQSAPDVDGVIAVTAGGQRENLTVLLRSQALHEVLQEAPTAHASLRSVWRHLRLQDVLVPAGSTTDVDTWEDVRRLDSY